MSICWPWRWLYKRLTSYAGSQCSCFCRYANMRDISPQIKYRDFTCFCCLKIYGNANMRIQSYLSAVAVGCQCAKGVTYRTQGKKKKQWCKIRNKKTNPLFGNFNLMNFLLNSRYNIRSRNILKYLVKYQRHS